MSVPGPQPLRPDPTSGSDERGVLGQCLPLGHWAGVAVALHWSVLGTIGLFATVLATSALPDARPGHTTTAYWVTAIATAGAFLVTLLAHELAHAVVARHYGMRVRRITLWMLGGLTELDGDPRTPRADALIALAGPAASLVAGGACYGGYWIAGGSGLFGAATSWLGAASLMIGAFNLLPGAPLDGGRVVRAVLWKRYGDRSRAVDRASAAGRVLGFTLVFLGLLEFLAGYYPGLWLALIGWFVIAGATAERYAGHERLHGLTAGRLMSPQPFSAPEWWTVERLLHELPGSALVQPGYLLVDFSQQLSGFVSVSDVARLPAEQRPLTALRDISRQRRIVPLVVAADEPVAQLAPQLRRHGGVAVVVDRAHYPVGLLTETTVLRGVQLAQAGWSPPDDGKDRDRGSGASSSTQEHLPAA